MGGCGVWGGGCGVVGAGWWVWGHRGLPSRLTLLDLEFFTLGKTNGCWGTSRSSLPSTLLPFSVYLDQRWRVCSARERVCIEGVGGRTCVRVFL